MEVTVRTGGIPECGSFRRSSRERKEDTIHPVGQMDVITVFVASHVNIGSRITC